MKERTVTFRCTDELFEEIASLGDKELRTLSDMIRILLVMGLREHKRRVARARSKK